MSEDTFSLANLLARCGVPKRFQETQLSQFTKSFGEIGTKSQSLFVYGPSGTGKTHFVCACITREINKILDAGKIEQIITPKGQPICFLPVPEFMLELRQSYNSNTHMTETDVLDKYARVKTLVLDDLGTERVSDWSIQMLYLLIDRRYREMRHTLLSSNLSLPEIAEKIDNRIASRIAEMCSIVKFEGGDRRLIKRKSA